MVSVFFPVKYLPYIVMFSTVRNKRSETVTFILATHCMVTTSFVVPIAFACKNISSVVNLSGEKVNKVTRS